MQRSLELLPGKLELKNREHTDCIAKKPEEVGRGSGRRWGSDGRRGQAGEGVRREEGSGRRRDQAGGRVRQEEGVRQGEGS